MTHWAVEYIGRPWAPDADGPANFSCWGLVRAVFRDRAGVLLPVVAVDEAANASEENVRAIKSAVRMLHVRPIAGARVAPQEMDIVLMEGSRLHCGVVILANGVKSVLHSSHATGVVCERWSDAVFGSRIEVWRRAA